MVGELNALSRFSFVEAMVFGTKTEEKSLRMERDDYVAAQCHCQLGVRYDHAAK